MRLVPLCRAACLALLTCAGSAASADQITVFAAASLREALDGVATAFTQSTGHDLRLSYAASSALARQIEQGAPADVFVSANTAWMDHLDAAGVIAPDSRVDLLSNRLVLIAHDPDAAPVTLSPETDLRGIIGDSRLAMALVDAVPVGLYGKAALRSLGLWDTLADRVAQADNARAALALVALGHAEYGIVYATDALAEPRVHVVATFAPDSHPPIVYPVAAMAGRDGPAARALLAFLQAPEATAIFAAQGFGSPE